jgi:uncharacterized protein YecT (DUF1311 family)
MKRLEQSLLRHIVSCAIGLGFMTPAAIAGPSTVANPLVQAPNCSNPQTQSEMNQCAGLSWQKSDQELNRVYRQLRPTLSATQREKLIDAQLEWIQYRNTECTFNGSFAEGGSLQPLLILGCRDQITRQRTQDLKAYLRRNQPPATSSQAYPQIDHQLNQLYQQLSTQISERRSSKLITATSFWNQYRNHACAFEQMLEGKTGQTRCLIRLTEQRQQQLEKHLNMISRNSAGSQKSEMRTQESGTRNQESEVRSQEPGEKKQETEGKI